jgi:hypothetical protein
VLGFAKRRGVGERDLADRDQARPPADKGRHAPAAEATTSVQGGDHAQSD